MKEFNNFRGGFIGLPLVILMLFVTGGLAVASTVIGKGSILGISVDKPSLAPSNVVTPAVELSGEKLHDQIDEYRRSMGVRALTWDEEVCLIVKRILEEKWWSTSYNVNDYSDVCKECSSLGVLEANGYTTSSQVLEMWKNNSETIGNLQDNKYRYGCGAIESDKWIYVMATKGSFIESAKQETVKKGDPSPSVVTRGFECVGPDGKVFRTSESECKKLNDSWGKPMDYMTTCNIPQECGGGSKYIKKSECDKPCTRLTVGSNV